MSQQFNTAWNHITSDPLNQTSKMHWGTSKDSNNLHGVSDSPQLSISNSPLTPQLIASSNTSGSVNSDFNGNASQSATEYVEKKQYSMEEMFGVYQNVKNNLAPLTNIDSDVKSSRMNHMFHVDLLAKSNDVKNADNVPINISKLNINDLVGQTLDVDDSTGRVKLEKDTSWANSNPIIGSAHFQDESSTRNSKDLPINTSIQAQTRNVSTPVLGNTPLPSVQSIPLLSHQNSFLHNSRPGTPLMTGTPDLAANISMAPPGIPSELKASEIKWFYLDPSGVEQGPFNGETMHQWYSSNFFELTLNIRREEETSYRTLADFMQMVGNYQTPFLVSLPRIMNLNPFVNTPLATNFNQQFGNSSNMFFNQSASGSQSSFFGSNQFNQFNQFQPSPQHQATQLNASNWNNSSHKDFLQNQMYSASSPFNSSRLQGFGLDNSLSQSGDLSVDNNSAPSKSPASVHESTALTGLDGISSRVVSGILESDPFEAPKTPVQVPAKDLEKPETTKAPVETIVEKAKVEPQPAPKKALAVKKPEPQVKVEVKPKVAAPAPEPVVPKAEIPLPVSTSKPAATTSKSEPVIKVAKAASTLVVGQEKPKEKVVPKKSSAAPWASHAAPVKPASTFEEVQMKEKKALEEQQAKKKLAAAISDNEFNLGSYSSSIGSPQLTKTSLPSTSNWATVGTTHEAPAKTLEEIQREEQRLAAAAAAKAKAEREAAQATAEFNALVSGGGSLASIGKPASATNVNLGSSTTDAWTLVSSKKLGKAAVPAKSVVKNAFIPPATNPSLLRSISASTIKQDPVASISKSSIASIPVAAAPAVTSTAASNPAREVVGWALSQCSGLNKEVNKEDFLSVLFALPSEDDYTAMIADMMYSSSSTIDGRRFAQEFIKRRKHVEDIVEKHGISLFNWNDIINNTSPDNVDDWDLNFTKVTKKNKKRN